MIVELILFSVAVFLILWLLTRKPDRYPPGPFRWPIFGNRLQMKSWGPLPYQSFAEATRRYGDVVGLYSGINPLIVVSSLDAIKEVASREDLSGRPPPIIQLKIDRGAYGVIMTSGEKWKEQRRFTLRHLRDLGFGKRSLEEIAHEELQAVFTELERLSGGQETGWATPVPVYDILGTAGINILWHIIAGKRYSHSDPYLNKLMNNVKKFLAFAEPGGSSLTAFPLIATIFLRWTVFPQFVKLRQTFHEFIQKEINSHKETLDIENPRDFIDVYLTEMEKQNNKLSTFEEKQLRQICVDLFMAGSDTTFNSITFILLYMILYPEVQSKVQEELDRVVGRDRLPSLEDRMNIPFVEATINEVLRRSSVAPISLPHTSPGYEKETEFRGYILPKNSRVFINIYAIHHDPKIWGDPQNFRPERFLDENGKFVKHAALIPFGLGKRGCLGEPLARNNLYLFFTGLMQRYSMKVPDGEPKPSEEPTGRGTLMPKPFKIQIKVRH